MHRTYERQGLKFQFRKWQPEDDPMLRSLMEVHMAIDPKWPPDYARNTDLASWLGMAANQERWVALGAAGKVVGHGGLGDVKPGPHRDTLEAALRCGPESIVEICRIVIHPEMRGFGLAAELTRVALRAAIESGRYPVSNVLSNRGSWLEMMLATGWQEVGRVRSEVSDSDIVSLLPPKKFVDSVAEMMK